MSSPLPSREERREFLAQRKAGLGSSDIAKIVGLHSHGDAMDVYIDKVSPVQEEDVDSIHLMRGIILEPIFADLYSEQTDRKIRRVGQLVHGEEEWATANLDRQILANGDRDTGALEIKSPSRPVYRRYIEEGIPEHIIVQHQWQLMVTGYDWGSIAWGSLEDDRGPLQYIDREANPLLQEQLMEAARRFWTEHVEKRVPPDVEEWGSSRVELPDLPGETVVIEDESTVRWAERIVARKRAYQEAKELYDEAKEAVVDFCKERNAKTVNVPGTLRITVSQVSGRSYPRWKQLKEHGALDPNRVRKMVRDELANHEGQEAAELVADQIVENATLDFDAFEKQGDDYYRPYITPQQEDDDE